MVEQIILDALREHAVCHLPKWPQMIVTGKHVTVDQAKEIIFRTDSFLSDASDYSGGNARNFNRNYRTKAGLDLLSVERKYAEVHTYRDVDWEKQEILREALKFIHTEYVRNDWASCAFVFGRHGWCHPDGTILYVDNIGKWPELESVYEDWAKIAEAFPFLDLSVTLMNKLIKQLADRATQYADGYDDRHEPIWWHFYNKRFAELIVEECCVVMNDHDSFYGEVMMSPLIKKHFGIEK